MFRASTLKEASGKARVPGLHNKVTLKADDNGLRPSDDHTGVCKYSEASRLTGVRPIPQKPSGDDTTAPKVGKRHVEPVHSSNSEATRRVEGRIGVRKSWNASTQVAARRTWGTEEEEAARSRALAGSQPRADHITSARIASTHTAEQKAERNVMRYAAGEGKSDAAFAERIEKARAEGSMVALSAQLERQRRVEQTHMHRDPMAMTPLKQSTHLGDTTGTRPPFAVAQQDEAPPNRHAKRTYDTVSMADRRAADAARRERMRNGVYRHSEAGRPLPFDTNTGDHAYPEPPEFGKSVPFAVRHAGKARPDAMRTDGSSVDMDTLSIQRAALRSQRSGAVAHANDPQDFIFGDIPPPTPSRNRTLAESHEMRHAANNERPQTGGKVRNARAYQKTSLW